MAPERFPATELLPRGRITAASTRSQQKLLQPHHQVLAPQTQNVDEVLKSITVRRALLEREKESKGAG